MHPQYTRRQFLQTSLAAAAGVVAPRVAQAAGTDAFSFLLLGDLHFDKLEHHDMAWLEKNKSGDLRQIQNYSRITADIMPRLFAAVRERIAQLNQSPNTRVAFILQVGDLVEGLCGTEKLATQQNLEALALIKEMNLGAPFLFTKGNHDVTGDGAIESFRNVFYPFLSEQSAAFPRGGKLTKAFYAIEQGNALFCFFDAYDADSLDWLEATLAKRTSAHCFVTIHPPVVPYGARATWHIYSNAKDRPRREKLLGLLGKQEVFVLGGHIHKFNTLLRVTENGGRFAQLAVSSVINAVNVQPKDVLSGVKDYNGDQIRVEPNYGVDTENERRAVYEAEQPFVKAFEYADLPGYAVVTVKGGTVQTSIYSGVSGEPWRAVNLTKLLFG